MADMKKQLFLVRRSASRLAPSYEEHDHLKSAVDSARGIVVSTNDEVVIYRAIAIKAARRAVTVDDVPEDTPADDGPGRNPR